MDHVNANMTRDKVLALSKLRKDFVEKNHVNTLGTHDKLLAFSRLSGEGWMLGLPYKIIQTRVFKAALDDYYDEYVKVKNAASLDTARYGGEEVDEEDACEEKLQKIVEEFRNFYKQQKRVLDSVPQKE